MIYIDSLSKKAFQQFLQDLGEKKFSEHYHIVDAELAKRYGMSRTPIRSAIQQLESEGILKRYGKSLVLKNLQLSERRLKQFILLRREYYQIYVNYVDFERFKLQEPLIEKALQSLDFTAQTIFPFQKLLAADTFFFKTMNKQLNKDDLLESLGTYTYFSISEEKLPYLLKEVDYLKEIFCLLKNNQQDTLERYVSTLIKQGEK